MTKLVDINGGAFNKRQTRLMSGINKYLRILYMDYIYIYLVLVTNKKMLNVWYNISYLAAFHE